MNADDFDGLVIPGGLGVAKNLSNIIDGGDNFVVSQVLEKIINDFYNQKKPIAACCIVLKKLIYFTKIHIFLI